jgi:hypothetical protein
LNIPIKKGASDGYRRPVLTSETTKRKKLSNMMLCNNPNVKWGSMDDGQTGYIIKKVMHQYTQAECLCMPGIIPFYGS